jgi:hypothetical protein
VTTYRAGTHHGVTICRENDGHTCGRPDHDCARGHLVAVITNDDWELAEHICDRLNAVTPDVTHTNGAAEALATVLGVLDGWIEGAKANHEGNGHRVERTGEECWTRFHPDDIRNMVKDAAAELGVDEDAPSGLAVTRRSAETGPAVPSATPGAHGHQHAPGTPPHSHGDSCTCIKAGPDPGCVVHQGRRARGPKPPNPPGCICDGSGRTCPRHGAVL